MIHQSIISLTTGTHHGDILRGRDMAQQMLQRLHKAAAEGSGCDETAHLQDAAIQALSADQTGGGVAEGFFDVLRQVVSAGLSEIGLDGVSLMTNENRALYLRMHAHELSTASSQPHKKPLRRPANPARREPTVEHQRHLGRAG